jgi:hypothetical protein
MYFKRMARYGRDVCGDIVCNNTWFLIRDAMSIYVANELAAGKTIAKIRDFAQHRDDDPGQERQRSGQADGDPGGAGELAGAAHGAAWRGGLRAAPSAFRQQRRRGTR